MALRSPDPLEPARPFLKWAGGKRELAPFLASLFPRDLAKRTYREPFLGGGAMFFHVRPPRAVLSDTLADLVAAYKAVQKHVDTLHARLRDLEAGHCEAHYYAVRERYNAERDAPPIDRAAWLIYLNRTGFNGLFRTNSKGLFNVPFGRQVSLNVADRPRLEQASRALAGATIRRRSFEHLLDDAKKGDFIYLDPPYVPVSKTANFSAYANGEFGPAKHRELAEVFRALDRRGCLLVLSNSDAPEVRELYAGYELSNVEVRRSINSKKDGRGPTGELVVRNRDRFPK